MCVNPKTGIPYPDSMSFNGVEPNCEGEKVKK